MITADGREADAGGSPPGRILAVRDRTDSDLDECVRLMAEVHRRDGYPLRWPADPRHFLDTSKIFAAWVATVDGQLVGHVGLSVVSPGDVAPRLLGVTSNTPVTGGVTGGRDVAGTGSAAANAVEKAGSGTEPAGVGTEPAGVGTETTDSGVEGRGGGAAEGSAAGSGAKGDRAGSGAEGSAAGGGAAEGSGDAPGDAEVVGSDGVAMVSRLFVGTAARGYGAGRALMHRVVQAAHERGLHLLLDVHSANTSAIALYERLGWNFLGTSHAQWGPDQVTLLSYTAPRQPRP
jgi:GNAT superfamily N-acetyltransferase